MKATADSIVSRFSSMGVKLSKVAELGEMDYRKMYSELAGYKELTEETVLGCNKALKNIQFKAKGMYNW